MKSQNQGRKAGGGRDMKDSEGGGGRVEGRVEGGGRWKRWKKMGKEENFSFFRDLFSYFDRDCWETGWTQAKKGREGKKKKEEEKQLNQIPSLICKTGSHLPSAPGHQLELVDPEERRFSNVGSFANRRRGK